MRHIALGFPLNISGLPALVVYYGHKVGYDGALIFDAAHPPLPFGGKLLVAVLQGGQEPVAEHRADVHVPLPGAAHDGGFHDARQADAQHRVLGVALFAELITGLIVVGHWGCFFVHDAVIQVDTSYVNHFFVPA